MKILAINTANLTAQLALQVDKQIYFSELDASMKHSENLLPAIEKMLTNAKISLKDLDYIAVNVGPGSFTGLRISIATVKAILLTNKNLTAIKMNSFEILVNNFFANNNTQKVNVILDALSGLYFHCEIDGQNFSTPKMITKDELNNFDNIISDKEIENVKVNLCKFTCENMLNVALEKINKKEFTKEEDLLPLYIRPSQAEANLNNKK